MTTDDGYQIPLLPVSKDVDGIIDVIPGAQVDVGKGGETTITSPDGEDSNTIVGIFDPIVMTSDEPPGIYRTGEGADQEATIVYHDGTLQRLLPTIQSPDEFTQAAKDIPDVGDVKINVDGSITINYQGADVTLKPLFDIESSSADGTLTPMITIEDGKFYFSNSDGDKQEFVAATAPAASSDGDSGSSVSHGTFDSDTDTWTCDAGYTGTTCTEEV